VHSVLCAYGQLFGCVVCVSVTAGDGDDDIVRRSPVYRDALRELVPYRAKFNLHMAVDLLPDFDFFSQQLKALGGSSEKTVLRAAVRALESFKSKELKPLNLDLSWNVTKRVFVRAASGTSDALDMLIMNRSMLPTAGQGAFHAGQSCLFGGGSNISNISILNIIA
jgi:hypothetical protein